MPRTELVQGLMPSILDRLIDPESAGTRIMTGYNIPQMYAAVLRDLEDLLNTRQTYRDLPAHFAEVRDSIISYGLPDILSVEAISAPQRAQIGRAIRQVIERFEPRLKDVQVSMMTPDENAAKHSVRFRVEARLAVDPAPDVSFDTILEMASGHYQVKPAADQ